MALPLSVAIVCRNNIATIGRTLDSVRGGPRQGAGGGELGDLADEIVAIDSGSTDGTIELLESRGARVISSEWLGHVRTKQKALEACTRPWILSIDSDESVQPDLAAAIREALSRSGDGPDGYLVNRRTYYRDRPLRHVWQPEHRLRLVRAGRAAWGGLDPHDKLDLLNGRPGTLPGVLRHDSFPTFAEHFRTQIQHATTMARSLHAAGERGSYLRLLVSPPGAFVKQLVLKRGFLDGTPGWLAASSTALAALAKHAALLELSTNAQSGRKPLD